jgi:hypothetical protein
MSKEALKLALEVLEELENTQSYWWQEVDEVTTKKIDPAITAIKAALEAKDGECKRCTNGCPACDARKLQKEAHDLF